MPTGNSTEAAVRYADMYTDRQLQRTGSLGGFMAEFLNRFSLDHVHLFDDFLLDTINGDPWTTNGGTGSTPFAIPGTPAQAGTIQAATGTDGTASNRCVNFYGAPIWSGAKNCFMEVRLKFGAAVTNLQFEVGWMDTMTTITTASAVVTDIDTPTFAGGCGDAAIVGMDASQTLTTMALSTLGSGAVANTGAKNALGTLAPTAATYMVIRLGLIGTTAVCNIDRYDSTSGYSTYNATKASAILSTTLLRPWIFISNPTNATTKTCDVDYVLCVQDR